MNDSFTNRLEQIDELKELYEELLAIAVKQQQLIEPEDEISWPMDSVAELQNQAQQIMKKVDMADRAGINLSIDMKHLPPDEQTAYIDKTEQIRGIIREIQKINRDCRTKLEPAMKKMSRKLNQTKESKKAQLAYGVGNIDSPAWFFDKKR